MTKNQKKAYVIGGVVLSLASGGIIGGTLALTSGLVFMPIVIGLAFAGCMALLCFPELTS